MEEKVLNEILKDIEMDDFHFIIKYGRKREKMDNEEFPDK